ncbi:hypothetical protein VTI74DRAFT_2089 [Chaetomium olivicolor]
MKQPSRAIFFVCLQHPALTARNPSAHLTCENISHCMTPTAGTARPVMIILVLEYQASSEILVSDGSERKTRRWTKATEHRPAAGQQTLGWLGPFLHQVNAKHKLQRTATAPAGGGYASICHPRAWLSSKTMSAFKQCLRIRLRQDHLLRSMRGVLRNRAKSNEI